jgi:hypothetical protein
VLWKLSLDTSKYPISLAGRSVKDWGFLTSIKKIKNRGKPWHNKKIQRMAYSHR